MNFVCFRIHKGAEINEIIDIPDVMFNAGRLRQRHFYDEVLLTLTRQSLQEVDSAVTQGVSVQFDFDVRFIQLIHCFTHQSDS